MTNDWQENVVKDFCKENNAKVIVIDEWKTREKKIVLRKGKWEVQRNICYEALPTLLISKLLNQMLKEIPAEECEI